MAKSSGFKLIANNKKAYFDFFIDDKFECGIACGNGSKVYAYGQVQHQGILRADHKRRGHDLRHAHQPV